jgi:hypothetical protein
MEDFEAEVQGLYGLAGTRLPFRRSPDIEAMFRPVSEAVEEFKRWASFLTGDDDLGAEHRADVEHRADEAFLTVLALIEALYDLILGAFRAVVVFARLLAMALAQPATTPTETPQDDQRPPGRLLTATPASPNAPPAPPVHIFWEALAA